MAYTRSVLVGSVPAAILAAVMLLAVPSSALVSTQPTTDSVGPHGYVTVSVVRDGQEIYHHEDHNVITDAGKDFISAQLGSTSPGGNGANYIALSSNAGGASATHTALAGEITTGGLERTQGDYAHATGEDTFAVTETFTATGDHTDVQLAGLFTASSGGTMMAENTFTPVSLANGDQLTITWTITLT